jgi:hypothetical protein
MGWTEQQKRWAAMRRGERSFYWPHLNPNYTSSERDMIKQSEINAIQNAINYKCQSKGMHPNGGLCRDIITSSKECGAPFSQGCRYKIDTVAIKMCQESNAGWEPIDHLVEAAKTLARHAKHANNCPFNLIASKFECTCGLNDALAIVDEWQL